MLNVFDDQRFLVRRTTPDDPVGHRVSRSFRELVTMPDNPDERLRFDYPLEYMNMAALGLCTALLQVAFEPADVEALAARIETPLSPEEFEGGVAPFRGLFTIDGPSGTRFLQGAEPPRDKKGQLGGGSLSDLLVTVKKGDKEFLNRPNDQWVVRLDQIPLLLFSRATYYEKSAGRGYYTGTSSDLEIRTYPVDPASLRRTIWMNVLCSEAQPAGDFIGAGSGEGYDGWMWHQLPSSQEIPKGRISLRSGLLWMIANMFIEIEEVVEPRPCIVTGDMISGRAGTSVVVSSAGYGYGVRVAREKGPDVRDSFFLHPNGPYFFRGVKEGKPYPTHLSVAENIILGDETFHRGDGKTVKLPAGDRGEGQQWPEAPGNLFSKPVKMHIDPSSATPIHIVLDQTIPPVQLPPDTKYVKHFKVLSDRLTKFWGRPIYLGATVLLPRDYDKTEISYPVLYEQGHFSLAAPLRFAPGTEIYGDWMKDDFPRMIVVTLQRRLGSAGAPDLPPGFLWRHVVVLPRLGRFFK